MQPMSLLIVTCVLFVGSHLVLSHPLRDGLAGRLGERGFQIVYSVVAIATLILVVQAWRGMPPEPPLWIVDDPLWILASLIVLFASILFIGSLIGNPALPAPHAARDAAAAPRGVFAITRHPMMWGFALWAIAHVMVMPTPGQIILSATIAFLALVGSAGQDAKKARPSNRSDRSLRCVSAFTSLLSDPAPHPGDHIAERTMRPRRDNPKHYPAE